MNGRILFVDDEMNILDGFKRQLHKRFEVDTALGAQSGLDAVKSRGPYAVVVSDLRMPGMDGIRFLAAVREMSPDTVRMMLTGQGDFNAAMAAVNEGHIFRFLTKPCSPLTLVRALELALEQYRLVTAEKELLESTLNGAIRVLAEVLSIVNPEAFSRAFRICRYVTHAADRCGVSAVWEVEIAAMLSQIGCITVPKEILDKVAAREHLSGDEEEVYTSHPTVARRLLENIPRLGAVAQMIERQQTARTSYSEHDLTPEEARIQFGAEILRAAIEFDRLVSAGSTRENALVAMRQEGVYSLRLLLAFESAEIQKTTLEERSVSVSELDTRMVIDEDVRAANGMLLLTRGQEVTYPVIERLKSFARTIGVVQPLKVLAPATAEEMLHSSRAGHGTGETPA